MQTVGLYIQYIYEAVSSLTASFFYNKCKWITFIKQPLPVFAVSECDPDSSLIGSIFNVISVLLICA